jgi:hypothetical protein
LSICLLDMHQVPSSFLLVFLLTCHCNLRWDIFFVQCWLLQHITPSMRHIEHHVGFSFLGVSLQGEGGVLLGPTKCMFLWFLNSNHEYKKWVRSRNVWMCFCVSIVRNQFKEIPKCYPI